MFIHVCVQLDVVHSCMCLCAFNYVTITCTNHDVLVNNMLPVSILETEQFGNTVEDIHNISLFCCFASVSFSHSLECTYNNSQ